MLISHLEPVKVWSYFEEICNIPRLSKNEDKIRQYLIEFATINKLVAKEDNVGNILITKEADPGFENRKTVLLQSHLDMVGEKDANTKHDWLNDPIRPIIEDDWVTAKVTTLGADDGIGIAAQMAILVDPEIKTGRLECLFTVDEESGMTGAIELKPGFFESKTLLNLDSEDEGELFIGCAGGIDTIATFEFSTEESDKAESAYSIRISGLHGGHSGDEIHSGYANSVKIIAEILNDLNNRFGLRIEKLIAGNLRNAIPREAFASIQIENGSKNEVLTTISSLEEEIKLRFSETESNIAISIQNSSSGSSVIDIKTQNSLLKALLECPHGVIDWSASMKGLVETSTNLASVKIEGDRIVIVTSQRSSIDKSKLRVANQIESIFKDAGAEVVHSDGYPGWEPNSDSEILKITTDSYTRLFGNKPVVRAIHAGLECGLILEKYPDLDMISFGPTIKGAHTPEEKINIESTQKFWELLVDVVNNIPEVQTE